MNDRAQRAVACAGFRLMKGMSGHAGSMTVDILGVDPGEDPHTYVIDGDCFRDCDGTWSEECASFVPDIDDPGTRGCFAFTLLPDAWGPDATVNVWSDGSVAIETPDPGGMSRTGSGYDDVVAALEAAPERPPASSAHDVMNLRSAYLAKSYAAGTSVVDILEDLCAACGLNVDLDQLQASIMDALKSRGGADDSLELTTGYNASTAPAWDQIQSVMDSLGLHWAAQDGRFTML